MKERRITMTCHGCKWLDEVKSQPAGKGYCSMVVRSKIYKNGMRVRTPEKGRCELYEEGSFKNRFKERKENEVPIE